MIWCVEDDPSIRELETYVLNYELLKLFLSHPGVLLYFEGK